MHEMQNGLKGGSLGVAAGKLIQLAPDVELPGFTMRFERNEEIFGEGEEADFAYKVVSGAVREVRILSDGRRHVSAFHLPGDLFGLERDQIHHCSADAVTDSQIVLIRRPVLERAARSDIAAAHMLWSLTAADLSRLQDHMLLLGRKTAIERVVSFLIAFSLRGSGSRCVIDLPMSRSDIADHLGLTIETVSRVFTQLEREQAISMEGARRIVLHKRLALMAA